MNSMSGEKLKGVPYTGTLPAVLAGTKAGYLHRYKVYGKVGQNLFDKNNVTEGIYVTSNGSYGSSSSYAVAYIPVTPETTYTAAYLTDRITQSYIGLCNANMDIVDVVPGQIIETPQKTFTVPNGIVYVALSVRYSSNADTAMLVKGSTAPESYIPYEECGERTENLANDNVSKNYNLDDTTGQPIPATSTTMKYWCMTQPINVTNRDTICLSVFNYSRTMFWKYTVDDGNGNVVSKDSGLANRAIVSIRGTGFMRIAIYVYNSSETYMDDAIDSLMLTEGSTAPDHYIPNGYKLPLLSGSTPVDIYIGDDTLSTEEYVDSGTGKIYRMVDGVLTPVDPPVPFPQIPTTANSTTISWAGEGLAPSEFDSIQEWVDIPTYKRVNGEWVEDN